MCFVNFKALVYVRGHCHWSQQEQCHPLPASPSTVFPGRGCLGPIALCSYWPSGTQGGLLQLAPCRSVPWMGHYPLSYPQGPERVFWHRMGAQEMLVESQSLGCRPPAWQAGQPCRVGSGVRPHQNRCKLWKWCGLKNFQEQAPLAMQGLFIAKVMELKPPSPCLEHSKASTTE